MSTLNHSIKQIRRAIKRVGDVEFAKQAGVPYTTLREWKKRNFRPKVFDTLEKLSAAAEACLAERDKAA